MTDSINEAFVVCEKHTSEEIVERINNILQWEYLKRGLVFSNPALFKNNQELLNA